MKFVSVFSSAKNLLAVSFLAVGAMSAAQAAQDPNQFVQGIANQALTAVKQNPSNVDGIVKQYLLPSADFEKTTRLATGQPWRTATADQKTKLMNAFQGTLVRTYSGAFKSVKPQTQISMLPFRGDPNASDVVVRSQFTGGGNPAISVDYRLEKSGDSWKVYDLGVEGIWLIQNYRNQFASEISKGGIDGLISALNQKNQ